jgi:hypothetical protein
MHKNPLSFSLTMSLLHITLVVNAYIHFTPHTIKCMHTSTSKARDHKTSIYKSYVMHFLFLFSHLLSWNSLFSLWLIDEWLPGTGSQAQARHPILFLFLFSILGLPSVLGSGAQISLCFIILVSFIGYILLTKSLSCKCVALTGMPYYFKVIKYLEFISAIWKWP